MRLHHQLLSWLSFVHWSHSELSLAESTEIKRVVQSHSHITCHTIKWSSLIPRLHATIVHTKFWYQKHAHKTCTAPSHVWLIHHMHTCTCTTSLPVQKQLINLTSSEICGCPSWPLPLLPQENTSPADVSKSEWKLPQLSWIMVSPGKASLTCWGRTLFEPVGVFCFSRDRLYSFGPFGLELGCWIILHGSEIMM